MKIRDMKLDEINRRGFLKTVGAAAATAAAPASTLGALAPSDTAEPRSTSDVVDLRQALTDEIKLIHEFASQGNDQTDHIIDELGDHWDDIEASGDEVAL